jgi:hypothetical protein
MQKQTGQENEEYPLEEYFKNMFNEFVKQKKLTLNAKDEDKFGIKIKSVNNFQ